MFFLPFRSSTRSVINRRKIKNLGRKYSCSCSMLMTSSSLCPCEEFEDLKLPTLDTSIWIGRSKDLKLQIKYIFFEKPINSIYVIHEKSAMDNRVYKATTQHRLQQWPRIKDRIIWQYSDKLWRSDYNVAQTREILILGLRGFNSKVRRCQSTNLPLLWSAKSSLGMRYKKKMMDSGAVDILNSKGIFNCCSIPRLSGGGQGK